MTVRSGFVKHKRYHTNDDYTKSLISEWTREETVEMNDGTRTLNDIMDAEHNKLNYGQGTVANGNNQVVTGKYNVPDNNNTYARITGGGTAATPANIETLDWQGNVKFAGTITTGNNINLNNIFNLIYPVGALYWSKNNTNPHDLFGGTWKQIKDQFILAAGDVYTTGDSGGSDKTGFQYSGKVQGHALSVNEMPQHNHTYTEATAVGSHTLSVDELPSHTHELGESGGLSTNGSHTHTAKYPIPQMPPGGVDPALQPSNFESVATDTEEHPQYSTDRETSSAGSHTHTLSGTTEARGGGNGHTHGLTTNANATTGNNGGGQNHDHDVSININNIDNMPPYSVYYCWERTAL